MLIPNRVDSRFLQSCYLLQDLREMAELRISNFGEIAVLAIKNLREIGEMHIQNLRGIGVEYKSKS